MTLVHRSLSGILPSYIANDRRLFADVRERRIYLPQRAEHALKVVMWAASTTGFVAARPGLWNCLPLHAKEAD